jgi:hypothetical protein
LGRRTILLDEANSAEWARGRAIEAVEDSEPRECFHSRWWNSLAASFVGREITPKSCDYGSPQMAACVRLEIVRRAAGGKRFSRELWMTRATTTSTTKKIQVSEKDAKQVGT